MARDGDLITYLIWQALAHHAQAQHDQALASLTQALVLAQPEGYIRSFVDEGEPMAELLSGILEVQRKGRGLVTRGISPAYIRELLAAFGSKTEDQRAKTIIGESSTGARSSLVEPLSKRELEVLGLLKTELSGPEIARELMVALSTVRTHTKSIYGKLGVNSRRAAVHRAEELGLL